MDTDWIGGAGSLISVILMAVFVGFCTIFLTLPMLIGAFSCGSRDVNVCACRRKL